MEEAEARLILQSSVRLSRALSSLEGAYAACCRASKRGFQAARVEGEEGEGVRSKKDEERELDRRGGGRGGAEEGLGAELGREERGERERR
eukprot:3939814-Rhodomonas_salina.1